MKDLVKVTLSFPIRCDRPNRNGSVFTEEAIKNAFASSNPHMPILSDNKSIGSTTPTYYFDYDEEGKICEATIEGLLFDAGPCIRINEMKDGKITDFDIVSVSLLK